MSRRFDGSNDEVVWTLGGVAGTGAWTFAMILKFDAGVSWQGLLNLQNTGDHALGTERHGTSGTFAVMSDNGVLTNQGPSVSSSDGWTLLAASRPAGASQTIRMTKYPIGGSPAHSDAAGVHSDNANAKNEIRFGNTEGADFFDGWLACCAIWDTNLSDADRASLATTMTRANWVSLAPDFLVDELDAFATDYGSGGSTQTGLVGTTDDADDPTGWASWAAAGGGGPSQRFRWAN